MDKIGFKNFRRFKDFPAIDLAPITFFVGENNAGKSTVVKGILALSDFFRITRDDLLLLNRESLITTNKKDKARLINVLKNQEFNFNTNYLAHIGTFKRALCNQAADNKITFKTQFGNQEFTINILGDRDNDEAVSGRIADIIIDIKALGLSLQFDLQNDKGLVKFYPVYNLLEEELFFIPPKNRSIVCQYLNSISKEYEFEYKITNYWKKFTPDLIGALLSSAEIVLSSIIDYEKTKSHIEAFLVEPLQKFNSIQNESKEFLKNYTLSVCPNSKDEEWIFLIPGLPRIMMRALTRIEYIYAHAVTQTVIYSAKDSNDYLSKTIHDFASLSKSGNDYRNEFIKNWMKEFKIGKDFSIISVGGEAHIVKIKNEDGSEVNLADKGMGSIQLMVLLFRLAITIPKFRLSENKESQYRKRTGQIIIIEEPEQNLHPKLQSKLADLLLEMNEEYGFKFIIETHSEYLIRKTQVMVSEMKLTEENLEQQNPFKVYYFPSDGIPYDMKYLSDGHFEEAFGAGFFDEAGKWTRELAKNRRK